MASFAILTLMYACISAQARTSKQIRSPSIGATPISEVAVNPHVTLKVELRTTAPCFFWAREFDVAPFAHQAIPCYNAALILKAVLYKS